MICALPFLMLVPPLPGIPLSAGDIMCRVAENQGRSDQARAAYVYDMNVFVRLQRPGGKLAREESRDFVVAPGPTGAARKLLHLAGRIVEGKKEVTYTEAGYRTKNMDIDGALTDSFARELLWKKDHSGPMVSWFPLSSERMKYYSFELRGEENYRGFDVYKVSFTGNDEDDECWKGEALIERREFQPVLLVTSAWTCKIPTAVKVVLGTNVQQVGAKIAYQRFGNDGTGQAVWFPVTAGGELKFRVLFMYARTLAFSAKNTSFRKADVTTRIDFTPTDLKDGDPN